MGDSEEKQDGVTPKTEPDSATNNDTANKEQKGPETLAEPPPEILAEPPPVSAEEKARTSLANRTSRQDSETQDTFRPPRPSVVRASVGHASFDQRASVAGERGFSDRFTRKASMAPRKSKFGKLSSKARLVLGSIVDIKTNANESFDKRAARFQNTYQMESDKPFSSEKVDKILKEVLHDVMENLHYDAEKCASTAKFASTTIRTKVKQLEFDRYKLVCIVSIGEKNSQDVYATCRFLWDSEKDRYSFYSLENTHVYGIAYCFGLYYE